MTVLTTPASAAAAPHAPAATAAAPGAPLWFLLNLVRVRVSSADSAGTLGIVEITGRRDEMPPLHVHHREDETFLLLEGALTVFLPGGIARALQPGEALLAPKGVPHSYRVESNTARWLTISTPAGFADFVTAAAAPAGEDALPPIDHPVDMPGLLAAAEAHGIEILGPPGVLP